MRKKYGYLIKEWELAKREMQDILVQYARQKKTITYGELSTLIQTIYLPAYSYGMAGMLDEISLENETVGKTPLAVLVVRKSDGRPGSGFFKKARHHGLSDDDLEVYWQDQFTRVCSDWAEKEKNNG